MKDWVNKVAVVTDCGDDIGITIIEQLAKAGMIVIGFNKDENVLEGVTEKFKSLIVNKISGKIVLCRCDITKISQLESAFEKILGAYEGVDVLVNNAYCNTDCLVNTGSVEDFRQIIDVNIYAVVAFIRLVAANMIEKKKRGHIININDLCSYQLPAETRKSVFIAAKAAITSVNEILRHEFRYLKANIKVTNIACGNIESSTEAAQDQPKLKIRDVAKLVKLILNTPEELQVHEVLIDSVAE
ncbi:unnamed protein product [Arctia plantaginis]|uniref:Farnesol dehydrogenase-like n=1 Tax=Arctia plantaginis TaxID=874455 RepID=A0A8S0ZQH8_ARCPL|nr:unnamed protein product [Arctia plantaginis]